MIEPQDLQIQKGDHSRFPVNLPCHRLTNKNPSEYGRSTITNALREGKIRQWRLLKLIQRV